MKKKIKKYIPFNNQPLLCSIDITIDKKSTVAQYPFSVPLIKNTQHIPFTKPVTFFVGENGSGKSTLLEAMASAVGFNSEGGNKNTQFKTCESVSESLLADRMKLTWSFKPLEGYFFRAESFFNLASYLDNAGINMNYYGGKSLHHQSHGESFISFFNNRLGDSGFYILDEPEAALSPQRQLSLLRIIHDLTKDCTAQFIIATHSPILLAYPNATIYSCDSEQLREITYTETLHYQITKRFLDNPDLYLKNLFSDN